mmetsp:Transcript_41927/g.67263  ORF Transcript_41927/g.67263 Transcript_41927/m.67263 type:complete len:136 (-) Transcript_41927:1556-1963(-)
MIALRNKPSNMARFKIVWTKITKYLCLAIANGCFLIFFLHHTLVRQSNTSRTKSQTVPIKIPANGYHGMGLISSLCAQTGNGEVFGSEQIRATDIQLTKGTMPKRTRNNKTVSTPRTRKYTVATSTWNHSCESSF